MNININFFISEIVPSNVSYEYYMNINIIYSNKMKNYLNSISY